MYEVLKTFQSASEPLLREQSFWFSIVMLTIAVRIFLVPVGIKQIKSTQMMQALAPEIKKLQEKHKNDKQKLNEEMMALYRERGFNPVAGCLPMFLQLPFFFAMYRLFYSPKINGKDNIL